MKKYFILGTDTDCGKTYVTCQLMKNIQEHGYTVRALKPVASGCELVQDKLVNSDIQNILNCDLSGANQTNINGWLMREPIAPHIAAQEENISLDAKSIANFCNKPKNFDYLLIEAAGGLMVPLNQNETWLDVLQILQIPVILVVGMRLGCINHSLLTIEVLKKHDVSIAGWIANCISKDMLRLEENINTLKTWINEPLLGVTEFNGKFVEASPGFVNI